MHSVPSRSVARWACAMEAAPTGAGSNHSNSASIGSPTDVSIIADTSASERGGTPSCSGRNART
eukprot:scaffold73908_cov35-Tisochrysis_lutea.AAC.2